MTFMQQYHSVIVLQKSPLYKTSLCLFAIVVKGTGKEKQKCGDRLWGTHLVSVLLDAYFMEKEIQS